MVADFILNVVMSKDVLLSCAVDVKGMTDAKPTSKCQIYSKYLALKVGAPAPARIYTQVLVINLFNCTHTAGGISLSDALTPSEVKPDLDRL